MVMGGRGGGAPVAGLKALAVPEPAGSPEARVSDVYQQLRQLKANPDNPWVKLSDFRDRFGGDAETLNRILTRLANEKKILIIPEENQQTLTPRDRAAALTYGGEANHLVAIGV